MNRITQKFNDLKAAGQKALVGYITAGDPNIETSKEIIVKACNAGIDVLELGVPFSDPTSDGPVIQRAAGRAIAFGMNLPKVIELVKDLRTAGVEVPIILFSYYNPIFNYGVEQFGKDAIAAGADGALIVDLPPEESEEFTSLVDADFPLIHLVAPTTDDGRLPNIVKTAGGFIYMITRTGVTGVTGVNGLDITAINKNIERVRKETDTPIALGFGISTAEDARALRDVAEGIVIGSAFEKIIEDNLDAPNIADLLAAKVAEIKAKLK